MKKIITLFAIFAIATSTFSQTDSTKTKLKPYASMGLSVGHVDPNNADINNFNKASYPSVEIGVMGKNISLGAAFGCENMFASSSSRGYYELKTSVYKSISGPCSIYGLFGVGAYMENSFHNFLEYGGGFSYIPNRLGYFVQYSNWARSNYVSFGVTVTF